MEADAPRALEGAAQRVLSDVGLAPATLVVAVSGGLDSVTLLHVLVSLAPRLDLRLVVGHVNHGLRGAESDADEAFVRALGEKLGLRVECARVDSPVRLREGVSNRERPTVQEAARRLRYGALDGMARATGADAIATAHHADDQVETVLLRLLRGCAPDGLGGIAERSRDGTRVRPLLGVSRAEIGAFAQARALEWREDASNDSPAYARNRLRSDWIPGLARDFNPQLLRAIGHLAEAQRRDSEWIEWLVEREARDRVQEHGDHHVRLARDGWSELPEALARRLARRALVAVGSPRDLSRVHVERTLAFLREGRPGRTLELPGGLRLACRESGFALSRQG